MAIPSLALALLKIHALNINARQETSINACEYAPFFVYAGECVAINTIVPTHVFGACFTDEMKRI
jgi:hypothetical protein